MPRRSATGRRGPYTADYGARVVDGRRQRSGAEAVRARLVAQQRERILTVARYAFPPRQGFYLGLYRELHRWNLQVTPRTRAAAARLLWPRGEARHYRVAFDERAGYTFVPLLSDPINQEHA